MLASSTRDEIIRLWDLNTGQLEGTVSGRSMVFSSDDIVLAIGGQRISLWDTATEEYKRPLIGNAGNAVSVVFSPDGQMLASGSADNLVHLWDFTVADWNIGPPRTVRLIYFLPNDQPYRADVVQRMKDEIREVQIFFAEQMGAHGYGNKTFRVETDSQGEPKVHRVDGQYPDNHYVNKDLNSTSYLDPVEPRVVDEIAQTFNIRANIYVIFIDTDIGKGRGGAGQRLGNGGEALIFPPINEGSTWGVVAHELGHAFGLLHDFRDGSFLMSYGPGSQDRLAVCHADFLDAQPYFNPDTPIKDLSAGDYSTTRKMVILK